MKSIFKLLQRLIDKIERTFYPFLNRLIFNRIGQNVNVYKPLLMTPEYINIGSNVYIFKNARIQGIQNYLGVKYTPKIVLEDNVTIQQNVHITCANSILIKRNTAIAANVTITDINHPYSDVSLAPENQVLQVSSVVIGEDCKIYNNVVILPGVSIGKHCVIGANSVVVNDIPDYCIAVGSPAILIKRYNFNTQIWETIGREK